MGQTAENLAWRFGITPRGRWTPSRCESHRRVAARAGRRPLQDEIVPLVGARRHGLRGGRRRAPRREHGRSWPRCKPFFDQATATSRRATVRRSPTAPPGCCSLPKQAVARWQLQADRRDLVDPQWAGLDPAQMGLGPVHAATPILQRHGLALNDLDAWEINEAFAAQVLGCLARLAGRRLLPRATRPAAAPLGDTRSIASSTLDGGAIAAGPSGRRLRRAHRAAPVARAARAAAERASPPSASAAARAARCWWRPCMSYQHWQLQRDADGIAWATLDRPSAIDQHAVRRGDGGARATARPARTANRPRGWSSAPARAPASSPAPTSRNSRASMTPATGRALVRARLGPVQPPRGRALSDAGADPRPLHGRRHSNWRSPAATASSSTNRHRAWGCPK